MPWTTNNFVNLPDLGASGATAMNLFHSGLQLVDTRLAHKVYVGDPSYGATPDKTGAIDAYAYFAALITAIGSDGVTLVIPRGTYKIDSNLTIPSNITLCFLPGAKLSITAGVTVTIYGHIQDTMHQIFVDNAIAADITKGVKFARGSVEYVRPEWFGAVGDNGTGASQLAANAAAINACNNGWTIIDTYFGTRGVIRFATGSYNVGNVVLTAKPGVDWLGTGGNSNARRGTRILKYGAVDTNLVEIATDGSLYHDVFFTGIRFESAAGNTTTSHGIYHNASGVGVVIKDCYFNGFYGQDGDYAVYASYQTHMMRCFTNNCSNGVYMGASDGSIVQCDIAHVGKVTGWSTVNPYYAVYAGGEIRIVGSKLMGDGGSAKAGIITTGLGVGTGNVVVGDTIIDNNRVGVSFVNTGSAVGGSFSNVNIYVGATYATAYGIKFRASALVYNVNWTGGKIFKVGSTWTAGYGIDVEALGYGGGNLFTGLIVHAAPSGPLNIADVSLPVNTGAYSRYISFRDSIFRSSDGKVERGGDFFTADSNEAITAGQWLYKAAAGYKIADANGSGTYPAVGKAVTAASATAKTLLIHERGWHRDVDNFAYTSGGRLYLDTDAGEDVQTAPTSGNFEQVLGYAYNADEIVIQPVLATRTVP